MSEQIFPEMTILVVEDNRTQAEYLRSILEKAGYLVDIASNGIDALTQVRANPPGIIVSDVMMPQMDGFELCRAIKTDGQFSAIPVLLVTYLHSTADVLKGLEAGADTFIIKPFEPDYLLSQIRMVISLTSGDVQSVERSPDTPLVVPYAGYHHEIHSTRGQILNILLSVYETAIRNNAELQVAHERMYYLNAQLEKAVADLKRSNLDMYEKETERGELEMQLVYANQKLQLLSGIGLQLSGGVSGQKNQPGELEPRDSPQTFTDSDSPVSSDSARIGSLGVFISVYPKIGLFQPSWQNLRNVIEEAYKPLGQAGIQVTHSLPAHGEIFGDNLLQKAFTQLFADPSVRTGITRVQVTLTDRGEKLCILCMSDGPGIPEIEKEALFSLERGQRSGMGLFLAREIINQSGFQIVECGIPGRGILFEIRCPDGTIRFLTAGDDPGF